MQAALGVRDGRVNWQGCSDSLNYSRADLLASVLPLYRPLLHSGIKLWVYSGDVDAIVPVTGTRTWLRLLDLTVRAPWRFWLHHHQVAVPCPALPALLTHLLARSLPASSRHLST